eukprot:jgi/Undpi1/10605/HiC_scaffold_29.g13055.m1
MDADGVSFGDFGAGSGGGGHRGKRGSGGAGAGGKLIVDQDLMDTWYPDCRECACCKVRRRGVWENSWERKISGIFQDVLEEESSGSKVLGGAEAFGVFLGYKHGCKTPACADAGLCACSSGDGPAVPIAAVASSNPPPGTEGSTGKPSTVEAVGGEGVGAENTAVAAAAAAPPPPA